MARRSHSGTDAYEQLRLLQSIIDALSAHVAVLDDQGRIILVNEAWRRFADRNGMTWDNGGVGTNYLETCKNASGPHSEEAADVLEAIRSILSGKTTTYHKEYPCHSPEEKRWFQVRLTSFEDGSGKKVVVAHETITEVKKAAEEVRASEERFRAIFTSAQDLIALKDCNLRYTLVNPAFEKLIGLPAQDIVGKKAHEIYGTAAGDHIEELDKRVLQGQTVEEEFERPVHGVLMTFHDTRVPLRNLEGQTIGVCVVSKDVTDRRRLAHKPYERLSDNYYSQAMREAFSKARRAAATDGTILLLGESGCGKDYLARWIHEHSRRSSRPFFAVNCAAISRELAESELFGHEPGAFTGARTRKRGLFELAEGGTLLLNEIGELPLSLQSKLLTFLDSKSFLRVGGDKHIRIDSRIIAATHRNLETEIAQGRFMEALFYRLNVFMIRVPPLRERMADLPILVAQILDNLAVELQLEATPSIDSLSLQQLQNYHWPGNVRELKNVLERSLILSDGGPLRFDIPHNHIARGTSASSSFVPGRKLEQILNDVTMSVISEALRRTGDNTREAALMLGISRDSIYRYLKRLGMQPPKRPRVH
uniref:PAS domain S-box protein n=1 Tax=Desulfomonile tiedjei TaxID=2358 RepID=A0A7C4ASZ5_9BACT